MTAYLNGGKIVFDGPKNLARELGAREVRGAWELPAVRMNARWLAELGLADDALVSALEPAGATVELDARLRPSQRYAAARLAASRRGAMLVMPPGTGKTPTAICAADAYTQDQVVVVTLPSLTAQWKREIEEWSGRKDVMIIDKKVDDAFARGAAFAQWLVISWDRVVQDPELFETKNNWPLWIVDENVLAKSRAAHRKLVFSGGNVKKGGVITKHYRGVRKSVDNIWMLSASPTTRYADDLWGSLSILRPDVFKSYWRTAYRYCTVEEGVWGKKITGDRPGTDIVADNDDIIIKVESDLELPDYIYEPRREIDLLPRQREAFDAMTEEFIAELRNGRQVVAQNEIAKLVRLQQITSYWDGESAKADETLSIMQETEPPYLIWTHWVEGAQFLYDQLLLAGFTGHYVNGATKRRDEKIEEYKAGKVDALVMSLGVGKFGHTLVNTRTEIRVDKTFNADDYFQSLHRVRRHGLDHEPRLFTLHARGSTDELIDMNQEGKMPSISKITGADLARLLRGLKGG